MSVLISLPLFGVFILDCKISATDILSWPKFGRCLVECFFVSARLSV